MNQLVISKIEAGSLGAKYMTCAMDDTKDYDDFINHPETIIFLGDRYRKTSWNSDAKVVYYRTY
ncbi:MAG: hypothetical protein V3V68_05145 [Nitrosomonadaceae bacterium]